MKTPILLLHGPSSSGKSTLAQTIREVATIPFWHLSIDHLRDSEILPMEFYRTGRRDWTADRSAIFKGFHNIIAAAAQAGNPIICEHILDDPSWVSDVISQLRPYDVVFVGLTCPKDVLILREKQRGNRPIGSALRDWGQVHKNRTYDLLLDGTADPETNAQIVLEYWRTDLRRSEFHTA